MVCSYLLNLKNNEPEKIRVSLANKNKPWFNTGLTFKIKLGIIDREPVNEFAIFVGKFRI